MKKIDNGWQVSVYEYNNTTVYKKPHNLCKGIFFMLQDYPQILCNPIEMMRWVKGLQKVHNESLKIISQRIDLWEYIGRPVIESTGAYYQDKIIPLYEYGNNLSEIEYKKLINKFVDFTYLLLMEKKVIDKSFNFGKNFGMLEGKIILSDIGETYFDEESFIEQITDRAWSKKYVLEGIRSKHVNYFLEKMDERFLPFVVKKELP